MKNSSLAMIATISIVVALAVMVGYIDPATCVNEQVEGWSSCEAAAAQRNVVFWVALSVAVTSYLGYRLQLAKQRRSRNSR